MATHNSSKVTLADLIALLSTDDAEAVVITDESTGLEYIFSLFSEDDYNELGTGEGYEDPEDS